MPRSGRVEVENGMKQMVMINYDLLYNPDTDKRMDTAYFKTIVNNASITPGEKILQKGS
jgi:hypothetical protein